MKKFLILLFLFVILLGTHDYAEAFFSSRRSNNMTSAQRNSPNLRTSTRRVGSITITTNSWGCNNWDPQRTVTFDSSGYSNNNVTFGGGRSNPPPPPPPPAPVCGSRHGNVYQCPVENWPSGSFCSVGSTSNPSYPSPGNSVSWQCSNGSRTVSCSAQRLACPTCGSSSREYEATEADFGESNFCSIGTVSSNPNPPSFPRAGEEDSWICSKNGGNIDCPVSRKLPKPWMSTRGGLVHVEGSVDLDILSTLYSKIASQAPEPLVGDEGTSLSTELLTLNSGNLSSVGWNNEIYDLRNYSKRINTSWYEILLGRAKARDALAHLWTEVEEEDIGRDLDLDLCKNDRQVYFINGDLEINPLDYEDLGIEDINGCIFVVKNDVIINEGEYKSEGMDPDDFYSSPGYDLVRGFFLVDGVIDIPFADDGKDLRDGLKVVGGLFATGDSTSIHMNRCLYVHNHKFPALIAFHDARYLNLAREVFGQTQYIRDIGFKE